MYTRKKLIKWQNIVRSDSSDKLEMKESELKEESIKQANDDLKIMRDCVDLVNTTAEPEVFFSNFDMMAERSKHLMQFEPYIKFKGDPPTVTYDRFLSEEQKSINNFLHRVVEKTEVLPTDEKKEKRYKKMHDAIEPYVDRMNEENRGFFEENFG